MNEENDLPEEDELETPKVIALKVPVDGIAEITLRELTVDEIARLNEQTQKFGSVRAMKNMIAKVGNIEVATVGKMGTRDFNACNAYLSSFFDESPQTSES